MSDLQFAAYGILIVVIPVLFVLALRDERKRAYSRGFDAGMESTLKLLESIDNDLSLFKGGNRK